MKVQKMSRKQSRWDDLKLIKTIWIVSCKDLISYNLRSQFRKTAGLNIFDKPYLKILVKDSAGGNFECDNLLLII